MKKTALYLGVAALMLALFHLGGTEPVLPRPSDYNGRYTIFSPPGAPGGAAEVFVMDTQTGRIWRRTVFSDVKGLYMIPLPYLSADQLSASAVPTGSEAFETLTMQKQYNAEVDRARAAASRATAPALQQQP